VLAVLTVLCAWQLSKALKRKKELADTAPAVDQK
jgi:beta-glucosidase